MIGDERTSRNGKLRSLALNLLLAAVTGTLTLVALEGLLRLGPASDLEYYVVQPNTRIELEHAPDVVRGVAGPTVYEVDEHGIRGRPLADDTAGEYRILAIGGSTTELLYIDRPRTWPSLLETLLDSTSAGEAVWVGNVGRAGQNSRDHVLHLKYLRDQYPGLDAVVILVGVNDLSLALGDIEAYALPAPITDPDAEAEQVRRAFQVSPSPRLTAPEGLPPIERLALHDLVRRARRVFATRLNTFLAERSHADLIRRWRENRREHGGIIDTLPDLALPLREYRRNLDVIVDLARERNLRLVLITQPYLWRGDLTPAEADLLWMGGASKLFQARAGSRYYAPAVLAQGMDLHNRLLLDVCRERGVECIDLASVIPRDTTMFFDDVHFTDRGSRAVSEAVAAYFRGRPPFNRPADRPVATHEDPANDPVS